MLTPLHADFEVARPDRADARVRHRAVHSTDFRECAAGGGGLALSSLAAHADQRLGIGRMETIGQHSITPPLQHSVTPVSVHFSITTSSAPPISVSRTRTLSV